MRAAAPPQMLEMLRGVRHAEAHARGQRLHAARALSQLLDEFDPMFVAQSLGHFGKRRTHGAGCIAA